MRIVHRVVLAPPSNSDIKNTSVVVGQLNSNHTDPLAVYLTFKAPAVTDLVNDPNGPGDCSVTVAGALPSEQTNQVYNWTRITQGVDFVTLLPGQKITLSGNVVFHCDNPGAVVGQTWTVKAIADVHGGDPLTTATTDNDLEACDTQQEVFNGFCNSELLEDDNGADPTNNTKTRNLPKVAT